MADSQSDSDDDFQSADEGDDDDVVQQKNTDTYEQTTLQSNVESVCESTKDERDTSDQKEIEAIKSMDTATKDPCEESKAGQQVEGFSKGSVCESQVEGIDKIAVCDGTTGMITLDEKDTEPSKPCETTASEDSSEEHKTAKKVEQPYKGSVCKTSEVDPAVENEMPVSSNRVETKTSKQEDATGVLHSDFDDPENVDQCKAFEADKAEENLPADSVNSAKKNDGIEEGLEAKSPSLDPECAPSKEEDGVIVEQPKIQPANVCDDAAADDEPGNWENDGWGWDTFENVITSATTKVSAAVERVEASLGIPSPGEFVGANEQAAKGDGESSLSQPKAKDQSLEETPPAEGDLQCAQAGLSSWFSGFGSHLTNAVQKTSQDLVTGSVGALEYIGKKTIDVLSEGDPGLRKKRGKGGPSLSQMLREAQEKTETADDGGESANAGLNFTTEFERFSGMDHLETLEVLSNESERKLERILNIQSDDALDESKEMLLILTKNFMLHEGSQIDAEHTDFGQQLRQNCEQMRGKATLSVEKLIETHKRLLDHVHGETDYNDDLEQTADEHFKFAISGLAEMTARCLELSRKTAEVLFADDVKAKSMCLTRASLFRKNTEILRNELSSLASMFAHRLDEIARKSESRRVSFLVTDVHLEGANCCTYMEDCHRLVLPILQLSAIR